MADASTLPMTLPRPLRLSSIILLIVAGTLLSAFWAHRHALHVNQRKEASRSGEQLALYANGLHTLIERYRALPAVLALDPQLVQALSAPVSPAMADQLNRKLERINGAAQSSTLELLDHEGLAVAASNWRMPTSYVGHNYAFRPYFRQTLTQGSGRFYAVGVTSGIPGYFLSSAVNDGQGRFLGAMVVKLEFPELELEWSQGSDTLLVSDARGIVFIANQPGWRYRELQALGEEDLAQLELTRQYDRQALLPLDHQTLEHFDPQGRRVQVNGPEGPAQYLWASLPIPSEGWTMHLLKRADTAGGDTRNAMLAAAGGWLSLVFGGLLLSQRWRLAKLRQRSREQLEQLVQARTLQLREAQDGLVQSAKLAALGQMSAALAHEISQPLTAQRMHLASLRLLLEQERLQEAAQALVSLEQLLSRMGALTGHLKTFARKSPAGLREPLDLSQVVDQALDLLGTRIRQQQVEVRRIMPPTVSARGDAIRLEQVLINLLRNALDAMLGYPQPLLMIEIRSKAGHWHLSVTDNGQGIAQEHLASVFDPFFTTKPVGDGLGLGLAVSYAIAHEQGGRLIAENHQAGARLTLILPQIKEIP